MSLVTSLKNVYQKVLRGQTAPVSPLEEGGPVREFDHFRGDQELISLIQNCVKGQRELWEEKYKVDFCPEKNHGRMATSPEALDKILNQKINIHNIVSNPEISNVVRYDDGYLKDHFSKNYRKSLEKGLFEPRKMIDQVVQAKLPLLFSDAENLVVSNSGFFLYPPGGYMGWHTNSLNPGWRIYISLSDVPEQSWFRYQEPESKKIVDLTDQKISFRLFKVCKKVPLWHAVYSDTYRYSLGFWIKHKSQA